MTLSGSGRSSPVRRLRPGPGGGRREPGPQAARQPCLAVRGRTAPQGCRSQRGQRRGGRSPPCSPAGESPGPGRPDTCGHLPLLRSLFRFIRSDVFEMELCPSLFAQGEESENERFPRARPRPPTRSVSGARVTPRDGDSARVRVPAPRWA